MGKEAFETGSYGDYITTVTRGTIVGYQGRGTGRPIFEIVYKGRKYKIAVTVGSNGYIVGANVAE